MVCRQNSKIKSAQMYRQRSHLGGDKGFDSHRSGGCERAADTVILFKSVRANLPIHVAPSYFISTSSSRSAATSRSLFGSLWFVIHIPFAVCSIFWNMQAPVYELELFCNRILSKPFQKKAILGKLVDCCAACYYLSNIFYFMQIKKSLLPVCDIWTDGG